MRIFVSWSGARSKQLAEVVREWLPKVMQSVEPWMSSEDIGKGRRWSAEIASELDACRFGIVCVTPENLTSSWLNFEAGALAKTVPGSLEDGRVTPLVLQGEPGAIGGPLAHFQATELNRADLLRLCRDINALLERPLATEQLEDAFEVRWAAFEARVQEIAVSPAPDDGPSTPSAIDERVLLTELLQSVRSQERSLLRLEQGLRNGSTATSEVKLTRRARAARELPHQELFDDVADAFGGGVRQARLDDKVIEVVLRDSPSDERLNDAIEVARRYDRELRVVEGLEL